MGLVGGSSYDVKLREVQEEALEILKKMENTQKTLDFQTKVLAFLTLILAIETLVLILR